MAIRPRILAFVDDIYEDLELWYPKLRLEEEGYEVVLGGVEIRTFEGKHGYPAKSELLLKEARETDFAGLLIPGGFMPDKLRRYEEVLNLTRAFHGSRKLIAMICHAGWIPISAKILAGRTVTSTPGIKDDILNAGAHWLDEPVVVDGHLISARRPPDLPDFGREILNFLKNTVR